MNIIVCDNIKDVAMQLRKQVEQQILDPDTTKEERGHLLDAHQSLGCIVRFLMQAIGVKAEREKSGRQV